MKCQWSNHDQKKKHDCNKNVYENGFNISLIGWQPKKKQWNRMVWKQDWAELHRAIHMDVF